MTNLLHQEYTALRARAYASLFGGPPSSVFPPHALFKKPDERFLIDIFVYTLATGTRDVEVAVTNGMSDQRMAGADEVVMAGEFGRTPHITHIARDIYRTPGRDHWGPVQTAFFAGGGVHGGSVIGASDANGAYPAADPQTPENFAATIYDALGILRSAEWHDITGRPYSVYMAEPIQGLRR
jgi:hypothetical protein